MTTDKSRTLWTNPPYIKPNRLDGNDSEIEIIHFPKDNSASELSQIEVSNPSRLLKLIGDLKGRNTKRLETKMNRYLKTEAEAKYVFLINILDTLKEAMVQVVQERSLEIPHKAFIDEDIIDGIVAYQLGCTYFKDLNPKIQSLISRMVPNGGEVIVVPVLAKEHGSFENEKHYPVYLVCLISIQKDHLYVSKLVSETFRYCSSLLLNARYYEDEKTYKLTWQKATLISRNLSLRLQNLNNLLVYIMAEARGLFNAERCSMFLMDPDHMEMVSRVFDNHAKPIDTSVQVRISKDQGIAGYVAATGEVLIVNDAINHPLFDKSIDQTHGLKTRNILCCPFKNGYTMLGVLQVFNKLQGELFDYFDERLVNMFCTNCALAMSLAFVYRAMHNNQVRQKLNNEMILSSRVTEQEVMNVAMCPSAHDIPGFATFSFTPRKILPKETPCFVIKMFQRLGLIDEFQIKIDILARFILHVQKSHLEKPYYNWQHGFLCAHFIYAAVRNFQMIEKGFLSSLEVLALMISAMCHDIYHRGTTNEIPQLPDCFIARIYSSDKSIMERYQMLQAICIFNLEGCNFLTNLTDRQNVQCLELIKNLILGSDLASHYKIHSRQLTMALQGLDKENSEHRYYLASLLMTCADLAEQTKDWVETKRVAQNIHTEFFAQGHLERKLPDEDTYETVPIPDLHLEFLNQCVVCIFKILATMFPSASVLIDAIKKNIIAWEASKRVFSKLRVGETTSFDVLLSEELETEVVNTLSRLE